MDQQGLFDYQAASQLYRRELEEAKRAGLSPRDAKSVAKDALYNKFPVFKNGMPTGEILSWWGNQSHTVDSIFGRRHTPGRKPRQKPIQEQTPKQELKMESESEKPQTFMDIVRQMAATGFIPKGEYLTPIIGEKKAQLLKTYISFLRSENNHDIEKTEHGWVLKSRKSEIDIRIEELQKQLDELVKLQASQK